MSLTFRYYCTKCQTTHSTNTKARVNAHDIERARIYKAHKKYKREA